MTHEAPAPKALDWSNIYRRAAWTAAEAFTGAIPTAAFIEAITKIDLSSLETLAMAAVASTVSALLSFVKTLATEQLAASKL
jgi:hypothetical protein